MMMADDEEINYLDSGLKLKEAFVEGSYEDMDAQAQKRKEEKAAWLRELIVVKRLDPKGQDMEGCTFVLSRRSLSRQALQSRVNTCPSPCIIDYLTDNFGSAVSMDDMTLMALPLPVYYVIVPERLLESFDILRVPNYDGETGIFLQYVPTHCLDRSMVIDEITLSCWIVFALMEGDTTMTPFTDNVTRTQRRLEDIAREVVATESRVFYDKSNQKLEGDIVEEERSKVYLALEADRLKEEGALLEFEREKHDQQVSREKRIGIRLERQQVEGLSDGICTWRLVLFGAPDIREVEDALIEKKDWTGIRLASHCPERDLPAWAGRDVVPVGMSARHKDYTGLEVKIAQVRIARLPHGTGVYRGLDRTSCSVGTDKFGIFYGRHSIGKRVGHGFEIDDAGVHSGQYSEGWRRGQGRLDLACGISITGAFGVNELRSSNPAGGFENPYLEGEPQGEVEILFGDGGWFKGLVVDGMINGEGHSQSGIGDVLKGTFVDGVLQGQSCSRTTHSGEEYRGAFLAGELSGWGSYEGGDDSCIGDFLLGLPHGRGKTTHCGLGEYEGFLTWGTRSGKGEFRYEKLRTTRVSNHASLKVSEERQKNPHQFKYAYSGFMIADQISSGGMVMSSEVKVPRSISQRVESVAKPLKEISHRVSRALLRQRRYQEKMAFMENTMRVEIMSRKHKIFRQQRHLTKKTMYEDDQAGVHERVIEERYKQRQDHLDIHSHGPPKTLLPGATVVRLEERNIVYQEVLDAIEPSAAALVVDGLANSLQLLRVAVSDIEEAAERQRFLKYDKIWARAEAAFIGLKLSDS